MSEEILIKRVFDWDTLQEFIRHREAVEQYLEWLNQRLQAVHNMRCDAYFKVGTKLPKSWGIVAQMRNQKEPSVHACDVTFKGLNFDAVHISGSRYLGHSEYDEYDEISPPFHVSMLAMPDDQIHTLYTAEATNEKAKQDARELEQSRQELQRKMAEAEKLNQSIAELAAKVKQ